MEFHVPSKPELNNSKAFTESELSAQRYSSMFTRTTSAAYADQSLVWNQYRQSKNYNFSTGSNLYVNAQEITLAGDPLDLFDNGNVHVGGSIIDNSKRLFENSDVSFSVGMPQPHYFEHLPSYEALLGSRLQDYGYAATVTVDLSDKSFNQSEDLQLLAELAPAKSVFLQLSGGTLNVPDDTALDGLVIFASGDVNLNGNLHLLKDLILVTDGNVNASNLLAENISIFAKGIHFNGESIFTGDNLLVAGSNGIAVNGYSATGDELDGLEIYSEGNLHLNASVDWQAHLVTHGNVYINSGSSLIGSVLAKGETYINSDFAFAARSILNLESAIEEMFTNYSLGQDLVIDQKIQELDLLVSLIEKNLESLDPGSLSSDPSATLNTDDAKLLGFAGNLLDIKISDLSEDINQSEKAVRDSFDAISGNTPNTGAENQMKIQPYSGSEALPVNWQDALKSAIKEFDKIPLSNSPVIIIIDESFESGSHGGYVRDLIQQNIDPNSSLILEKISNQGWTNSLKQAIDKALSEDKGNILVNLSFDIIQRDRQGNRMARTVLTEEELAVLTYAEDNDVAVIVAAGNQGNDDGSWGKAVERFSNILVVGLSDGSNLADVSSQVGVNGVVIDADLLGTSGASAITTAALSDLWTDYSNHGSQQILQAVREGANDVGKPGVDAETGWGTLDIARSQKILANVDALFNLPVGFDNYQDFLYNNRVPEILVPAFTEAYYYGRNISLLTQPSWQETADYTPGIEGAFFGGFFKSVSDGAQNIGSSVTNFYKNNQDAVHTALDIAGYIPVVGVVADVANAGLYAAKGDYANAGLSLVSAIPGIGDAVGTAGKGIKTGTKAFQAGTKVLSQGKGVTKAGEAVKNVFKAEKKLDIASQLAKFKPKAGVGATLSKQLPSLSSSKSGQAFNSFGNFKAAKGAAGQNKAWHHLVEQNKANMQKFGSSFINNTSNLVRIDDKTGGIHKRISGFYSSSTSLKQDFLQGQNFRKWVGKLNFENQEAVGKFILEQFGGKIIGNRVVAAPGLATVSNLLRRSTSSARVKAGAILQAFEQFQRATTITVNADTALGTERQKLFQSVFGLSLQDVEKLLKAAKINPDLSNASEAKLASVIAAIEALGTTPSPLPGGGNNPGGSNNPGGGNNPGDPNSPNNPIDVTAFTQFQGKYYTWEPYTIQYGETLSGIALATLGNGTEPYYQFIANYNGIANPNRIYANDVILLPIEVQF
jgi:LysM domain